MELRYSLYLSVSLTVALTVSVLTLLQGTYCSPEHVSYVQRRGGHIVWLSKDIRKQNIYGTKSSASTSRRTSDSSAADDLFETQTAAQNLLNSSFNEDDEQEEDINFLTGSSNQSLLINTTTTTNTTRPQHSSSSFSHTTSMPSPSNTLFSVPSHFPKLLQTLSTTPSSLTLLNRSLYVSFSLSSIQDMACPGMSLRSPQGFTSEEALLLCRQSGIDQNVSIAHTPSRHTASTTILHALTLPPLLSLSLLSGEHL
jgi:hypothetical protein